MRSLVLLAFLALAPVAAQPQGAATPGSAPAPLPSRADDSPASLQPPSPNSPTPSQLDVRIHDLEREVDSLQRLLTVAAVILGVILALATSASLFSLYRSERRTEEADRLGIAGEQESQRRATDIHHSFLEGSKTTLELVNATLTLARDASERASRVLEVKAREALEILDRDAKHLLAKTKSDDRALVRNPTHRSALMSLAQRLEAFEINRFILPPDIKLTPPCLFLRGMEQHLKQHFEDALAHWDQVALDDRADAMLRTLAWLWIGYEYNNLGKFSDAVSSFENALTLASGARRFELQRNVVESRLFNGEDTAEMLQRLEALLKAIDEEPGSPELQVQRVKICSTLGNVLHVRGETARLADDRTGASGYYVRASEYFGQAFDHDQWARFGRAEALFRAGSAQAAADIFEQRVLPEAQRESINRMEPRTKVLERQTELICHVRLSRFADLKLHTRTQVLQSLAEGDERLTVYSQIQRRNVSRSQLQEDIDTLLRESPDSQTAKAGRQ